MLSKFFINRPIFATVLAILMVLAGVLTVTTLPISQYPDITPPTVQISASYPGASAETVAETVGTPIEEQVNGIEGMMYMSSNSGSDGSYGLTITFDLGTDIDEAAVKVQNRVALAQHQLPESVKEQGVSVTTRSSNIIMFIDLESNDPARYDALYLTNYAKLHIVDELSRLKGVGQVSAFGAGEYSMRVWLDPAKLQIYGLTPNEVEAAIQAQNIEISAGQVGAPPTESNNQFEYSLTTQGLLSSAEDFENIVIRTNADGGQLRLSDVARVDLGSEGYSMVSRVSNRPAGLIGVYQLPGANALDVAKRVKAKMNELEPYFPDGIKYNVILDTTQVDQASIKDVLVTFVETTLIVMLVILLFLQNWRAVIIPMITIPVSLIATFAVMKLLGFSINTLTLFGLVLAIALVVDDAIVVVEDCSRIVDEGKLSPKQAAIQAMKELQGPVIGEVLVLLSVFIPTAFISGITGQLYKQFALTIAVSTAFSGFNALTFTPAMCALFLKPQKQSKFFIYKWFNKGFNGVNDGYTNLVTRMLKRPAVAFIVFALIIFGAFWGFSKWPTSYIPEEDNGYFLTSVELPQNASLQRTDSIMNEVSARISSLPEVKDVISVSGQSFLAGGAGSNLGSMFVVLQPWKDRKGKGESASALIDKTYALTADIQEAEIFSVNPPAIPGLGASSGLEMNLLDINSLGTDQLKQAISDIEEAAKKDPRIASVTSLYQGESPMYKVKFDRDKIHLRGLTVEQVYNTLSSYMAGSYVNDFEKFGRLYEVQMNADPDARAHAEAILNLSVQNSDGSFVPFSSFAEVEPVMGPTTINRYNMYESASLTAHQAKNVSSSDGIKAMEQIVKEAVGDSFSYAWTGEAYQETGSGTTITSVLVFAILITILVLAAQYESWTNPIAVVITVPTAILGTILGCFVMNQSISIYTEIGIILLIGMAAKNAILIVNYASDYRKTGLPLQQAALDAGRVRFRPIMMTALAFVFGVMPMLFATGAGAGSRISLGTAVVFGMAINAVLGTLFVPNFWELLQHFQEKYLSRIFAGNDVSPQQPQQASPTSSSAPSDNVSVSDNSDNATAHDDGNTNSTDNNSSGIDNSTN